MDNVLVVGSENEFLVSPLRDQLDGAVVRGVETAALTEGLAVDVVVIAGSHPMEELAAVRVHPRLYDVPVLLFAPGRTLPARDRQPTGALPVTTTDDDAVAEIAEVVAQVLARPRHPSSKRNTSSHAPAEVA